MRFLRLIALALIVAAPAFGQAWTTSNTEYVSDASLDQYYVYSFGNTATDSNALDLTSCAGGITWEWDPSTQDSSTDASFQWRTCSEGASTSSCRPIDNVKTGETTGTLSQTFWRVDAITPTVGSDLARVRIRC